MAAEVADVGRTLVISPAQRLDGVKPSPSMAAAARAALLRAEGKDVIDLSVGEPDFPTPAHVVEAAHAAALRGETRYTPVHGTPALRAAVSRKFRRENGLDYAADEVAVSSGAKQIIHNAMLATLRPGDEVVIPAPCWVSYVDMVRLAEGRPVVVRCPAEAGFKLTPDRLLSALTERTRWLVLNSPGNPTGAVYGREELRALAEILADHPQVAVLSDDIYEHIVFDGRSFATMAEVAPALKNRTLTVNGVSKAYAMTGWRIGYAGGPRDLIERMARVQSQSTTAPTSTSQAAAVAALDGPQDFVRERTASFQARRDLAAGLLRGAPGLTFREPEGAFYLFVDCSRFIGATARGSVVRNDENLASYLLEEANVAVVHGAAYEMSPCFRLSFAVSRDVLADGLERLKTALAKLETA